MNHRQNNFAKQAIACIQAKRVLKYASCRVKRAGVTSDYLAAIPSFMAAGALGNGLSRNSLPTAGVGQLGLGAACLGGTVHGLISGKSSPDSIRQLDENPGTALLPGVSSSRLLRRRRAIRKWLLEQSGKGKSDADTFPWSEYLGIGTSVALPTLLGGAGLGALLGNTGGGQAGAGLGALVGGTLGLGAGALGTGLGLFAALVKKRRTLKEQQQYENNIPTLKNLLIPGYAAYNTFKGFGASKHITDTKNDAELLAKLDKEV